MCLYSNAVVVWDMTHAIILRNNSHIANECVTSIAINPYDLHRIPYTYHVVVGRE